MEPPAGESVEMEIKGLVLDPTSNVPIVILHDQAGQVFLPIWIGVFEANAIALQVEGIEPPRPMTHDLLRSALETLGAEVLRIVISDLRENTFYARILLRRAGEELMLDSRPSDAIALALRVRAPIFVLRTVLDQAKAVNLVREDADEEQLKKWLEEIRPEDLGKYEM